MNNDDTIIHPSSPSSTTVAKWIEQFRQSQATVVLTGGTRAESDSVHIQRTWVGNVCTASLTNCSSSALKIERVDLFDFHHGLPGSTPFYGESFQMLAQNIGTLEAPRDLAGSYPDRTHYRLYEVPGLRTARGMLTLRPSNEQHLLLGFASCRRFDGLLSFNADRLVISCDGEGLELAPGERWELEEFFCAAAPTRQILLDALCQRIERHHPRRTGFSAPPLGWCSWYCFGPEVTVADIQRNLAWIAQHAPELRYIQIDDGYQPWMGDWLESGTSFGGDIRAVLAEIRQQGFEPAIWLAPFIASPQSKLFRDHPDWFIRDEHDQPLCSDQVGFGGWRQGPWYAIDGTHPQAQRFIEQTFRTMRHDWGCTYFKLDANYWGALNHGRFHDPHATRIEAYRRGMEAALRGAGDAFILGCNHPIWPSLGLIDGSRTSNDMTRTWASVRNIGQQNLLRCWQNGRVWWNDPDCVLLSNGQLQLLDAGGRRAGDQSMTWNELIVHATTIHASGGMLLSGDNLPALSPQVLAVLRKLIPPTGIAASFTDETLAVGRAPRKAGGEFLYLFNWGDEPVERCIALPMGKVELTNYWTGETLGPFENEYRVPTLPPRSALLLVATRPS